MKMNDKDFKLNQVVDMLSNGNSANIALTEFYMMCYRVFFREAFELIKNYLEAIDHKELSRNADWWEFARMIRNAVAHNFEFGSVPDGKSVTWRNLTITKEMKNTPLTLSFYGFSESMQMFEDMVLFVKNELS